MTRKKLVAICALLALLATACGGTDETSTADDTPPETTAETTPTTEAEVVEEPVEEEVVEEPVVEEPVEATPINGQELYESNCSRCHGIDGIGTRGPDLIDINTNVPDMQEAFDQIVNGGGGMPSFGSRLSDDEIQAMVDYVYSTF